LLKKSEIYPDLEEKSSESIWLQCINCFTRPIGLNSDQFEKMLPCTAISFKLTESNNPLKYTLDKSNSYGSIFCFLPLPARTKLNFNLNANFFLTSTREDIIYSSGDRIDKFESDWNGNLQTCLSIALKKCCESMVNFVDYEMTDLMNLWPINTKLSKFEKEFYEKIFDYNSTSLVFNHKNKAYSID
jgi:hypothetical protein